VPLSFSTLQIRCVSSPAKIFYRQEASNNSGLASIYQTTYQSACWYSHSPSNHNSPYFLHYTIFACYHQIITLVTIGNKWSSYAWDMKRRQLTIHAAWNKTNCWDAHDKIASMLTKALCKCIDSFFQGWDIDWKDWQTVYSNSCTNTDTPPDRLVRQPHTTSYITGLYALAFLRMPCE
jgi:hypothetical protein